MSKKLSIESDILNRINDLSCPPMDTSTDTDTVQMMEIETDTPTSSALLSQLGETQKYIKCVGYLTEAQAKYVKTMAARTGKKQSEIFRFAIAQMMKKWK